MKYVFYLLAFFAFTPAFALPIDLSKNWQVTTGWILEVLPSSPRWIQLDVLPLSEIVPKLNFEPDNIRYVTMHKSFIITNKDMEETAKDAFSLHIPYISNVYQVYINGDLVSRGGEIEDGRILKSGYRRHITVGMDRYRLNLGWNEIRILIASAPGEELSVYRLFNDIPAKIDFASENRKINEEYFTYMLLFLYFFVGVYHGLFYIKRKKETYNLYYALFAVFLSVYMIFRSQAVYILELEPYLQSRLEYFVVFFISAWLLLFTEQFFRGYLSKISLSYLIFVCVLALVQFFVSRAVSIQILLIWQVSVLVFSLYTLYLIIGGVVTGNRDAKRMLFGFVVMFVSGCWDVLGSMGVLPIQNLGLLRFGFLFFVLGIAVVLANRFLRVHKEVEKLNATLEKKVEERTNDLQRTLTTVQELKIQQDGDYFLTSLLLEPLSANHQDSPLVQIESYTKQKKEFEFRNKKREIGGDIIITDVILLNGKKYTVFVNGDAMGKSMQGAGGALVLGVVFLSFIKRTQSKKEYKEKSPERWLKECFLELQSIFESFDGSMLISVVIGLVEEETGLLYYINAEHPWTVLYRDGVACFIEEELELRKIGTKGMEGEIRIRIFPLQAEDVLFVGSDGRDDLILSEGFPENRLINEDETQFLRRVEESNGNLEDLAERLKLFGDLSDDLTLIRLEWKGERPSLDDAQEELRESARTSLQAKDYESAVETLEKIFTYLPTDNEILLQLSYAYRKLKHFKKAIDLGERLRSRDPKHFKNLVHLIGCYRLVRNEEKAKRLLSKLGVIDSEHPQYLKLKSVLEGKSLL
ncbi:SpoIIE family protein phosphatase [Leptospira ilyithenensis]|uniref:Stage II sporulation protein E n=1 Tax=Leptospira ilyithenensis TaxID=2484901 RepID=A0A4R9LPC9_9LEPT|nr:SpoIIE family protein phosphatase [Leptospira ilyithenensis]TGN09800.1 stage II sporulation protein E [Leptospira ilyithenensis]